MSNEDSNTPADDNAMHDCARGERCAARKTVAGEDGKRFIVPAQTYRNFCETDRSRIHDVLADLPARYAELGGRIGDKGQLDGPRVSGGTRTPAPPMNLGVEAFMQQIGEVVLSWEERVRQAANLSAVFRRRDTPGGVRDACRLLVAHVDALLSLVPDAMTRTMDIARHEYLPDDATGWVHLGADWVEYNTVLGGVEAGTETLNLHHRCLARLGRTPQHHDLITACWACGERKLRRHDGTAGLADHVECLKCNEQYLGSRLLSLMVEEDQAQQRKRDRERRQAGTGAGGLHASIDGYGGRP